MEARPGDEIVVDGVHTGDLKREGEILPDDSTLNGIGAMPLDVLEVVYA